MPLWSPLHLIFTMAYKRFFSSWADEGIGLIE